MQGYSICDNIKHHIAIFFMNGNIPLTSTACPEKKFPLNIRAWDLIIKNICQSSSCPINCLKLSYLNFNLTLCINASFCYSCKCDIFWTWMRRNTSSVSITTCIETYKSKHSCTAVYRTWLRLYPPAKANKLWKNLTYLGLRHIQSLGILVLMMTHLPVCSSWSLLQTNFGAKLYVGAKLSGKTFILK